MSPTARCSVAFATFLAVVLLHPARADADPAAAPTADRWYGWQTLGLDGASLGVGLGVGAFRPGAGVATFAAGFALGGPLVHWVHHRLLAALASLGLRVGAPLALTVLGAAVGLAATSNGAGGCARGRLHQRDHRRRLDRRPRRFDVDSVVLAREPAHRSPCARRGSAGRRPSRSFATPEPAVAPLPPTRAFASSTAP